LDAQTLVDSAGIREEIAEAMIKILSRCFGAGREGLLSETRKVYGFGAASSNITVA
jgi:hypothetical protein